MANPAGQHEIIDLTLSDDSFSEEDSEDEMASGAEDRHPTADDDDGGDSEGDDSDASEVEVHLNEETRAQLRQAIATVSERRLRELLTSLIETNQAVEIALTGELITVKRGTQKVVPRWEVCANCDADFDVNRPPAEDECEFHPGELEPEEDEFPDWDEDCHGPIDTPENQREWPEKFIWTCCDNNGRSEGCVHSQHKPREVSKKRKRN